MVECSHFCETSCTKHPAHLWTVIHSRYFTFFSHEWAKYAIRGKPEPKRRLGTRCETSRVACEGAPS